MTEIDLLETSYTLYTSKVFPDRSTSPAYKVAYLGQHQGIHCFSLFCTSFTSGGISTIFTGAYRVSLQKSV
jgi:hypothetical protein